MAVQPNELQIYRAAVNNDTAASGGRITAQQAATNQKNNIFPDVTQAERLAGFTRWRKLFYKIANADNIALNLAKLHMVLPPVGDDVIALTPTTQRSTQDDLSSPDLHGIGKLKENADAAATSFIMVLDADEVVVRTGDTVWIGDGTNEEYFENITVDKSGLEVTITLDGTDELAHAYLAADTHIAAVIEQAVIEADFGDIVDTDNAYDFGTHPPGLSNIGTIEQTWTLTLDVNGTSFVCEGDTVGEIATGQPLTSDFTPMNQDFIQPYFTLGKDGWSGGLSGNEIVQFRTSPAALPFFVRQLIPEGIAAEASNFHDYKLSGESAE